jgi:Heterokaryon incompatibility protein (HET)
VQEDRIVKSSPTSRYLTLSYVWGAVPTLRLQKDNKNELMSIRGLKRFYSAIPRTIRDAMELCRLLNERYLWVDSLCLIQDDPLDVMAGIQSMNFIYEQSSLNIIAGSGEDAEAGLPGVQKNSRHVIQHATELGFDTTLVLTRDLQLCLKNSKYITRGWTYVTAPLHTVLFHCFLFIY